MQPEQKTKQKQKATETFWNAVQRETGYPKEWIWKLFYETDNIVSCFCSTMVAHPVSQLNETFAGYVSASAHKQVFQWTELALWVSTSHQSSLRFVFMPLLRTLCLETGTHSRGSGRGEALCLHLVPWAGLIPYGNQGRLKAKSPLKWLWESRGEWRQCCCWLFMARCKVHHRTGKKTIFLIRSKELSSASGTLTNSLSTIPESFQIALLCNVPFPSRIWEVGVINRIKKWNGEWPQLINPFSRFSENNWYSLWEGLFFA